MQSILLQVPGELVGARLGDLLRKNASHRLVVIGFPVICRLPCHGVASEGGMASLAARQVEAAVECLSRGRMDATRALLRSLLECLFNLWFCRPVLFGLLVRSPTGEQLEAVVGGCRVRSGRR